MKDYKKLEEVLPAIREGKKVEVQSRNSKAWFKFDTEDSWDISRIIDCKFRIVEEPIQVTKEMLVQAWNNTYGSEMDDESEPPALWNELVRLSKERE